MRPLKNRVIGSLILSLVTMTFLLTGPSAQAQRGEQPIIHEGQVVEITDTEVRIKEWAGHYTYRLIPGGRQALAGAGIRPGDKVSFYAWEAAQIAFDFKKR